MAQILPLLMTPAAITEPIMVLMAAVVMEIIILVLTMPMMVC